MVTIPPTCPNGSGDDPGGTRAGVTLVTPRPIEACEDGSDLRDRRSRSSGGRQVRLAVVTDADVVIGASVRRRSVSPSGWGADSSGKVVGPRWPSLTLPLDAAEGRQIQTHLQWEAPRERHGVHREEWVAGSEKNA